MKKIGSFRVTGKMNGAYGYDEAYARGDEFLGALRQMAQKGEISLFCGCNEENCLPLMVTAKNVIRVASNGQQELHMESCPKSNYYSTWVVENEQSSGILLNEDQQITFNISIPSGVKSSGSSSSSSSSESNPDPFRKRTAIYDMCRVINCLSFQKQGYSIKKQIGIALKEKRVPDWRYKNMEEFNKLWFGVTNDVNIKHSGEVEPFHNILYRSSDFFKADFKQKFFVYAEIEKVHEYKEGRKWQYITLKMPSNVSANKAVIRLESAEYEALVEDMIKDAPGITNMLCGYVRHDVFRPETEPEKHFITLIKYSVLPVSDKCGLFLRNPVEEPLISKLLEKRVLFYRPWNAIPEYGDNTPTMIIQRKSGKDLLVDCCKSNAEYEKRKGIPITAYDTLILNKGYGVDEAYAEIIRLMKKGG